MADHSNVMVAETPFLNRRLVALARQTVIIRSRTVALLSLNSLLDLLASPEVGVLQELVTRTESSPTTKLHSAPATNFRGTRKDLTWHAC